MLQATVVNTLNQFSTISFESALFDSTHMELSSTDRFNMEMGQTFSIGLMSPINLQFWCVRLNRMHERGGVYYYWFNFINVFQELRLYEYPSTLATVVNNFTYVYNCSNGLGSLSIMYPPEGDLPPRDDTVVQHFVLKGISLNGVMYNESYDFARMRYVGCRINATQRVYHYSTITEVMPETIEIIDIVDWHKEGF